MARAVLIDECLPHALRQHLAGHETAPAVYAGFSGLKNGALLRAAEEAGFEVLLTGDKSLEYEQNLQGKKLAVVALSANGWNILKNHIPGIGVAIAAAQPGTVTRGGCWVIHAPKAFRSGTRIGDFSQQN